MVPGMSWFIVMVMVVGERVGLGDGGGLVVKVVVAATMAWGVDSTGLEQKSRIAMAHHTLHAQTEVRMVWVTALLFYGRRGSIMRTNEFTSGHFLQSSHLAAAICNHLNHTHLVAQLWGLQWHTAAACMRTGPLPAKHTERWWTCPCECVPAFLIGWKVLG